MTTQTSEFDKFDAVMRKVLTVSHEELKVREARMEKATWQKKNGLRLRWLPALPAVGIT